MLRQTGMLTRVGKHDACQERASSTDRPLSSAVALLILHDVHIDGILLTTVDGRELRLRRVAWPNAEQAELLVSLKLTPPERICADREMTDPQAVGLILHSFVTTPKSRQGTAVALPPEGVISLKTGFLRGNQSLAAAGG